MGKQSKTKSTQAAVIKDKDIECSRTTIENRLIEDAKCDDDKTEDLHAFVDDMLCLNKSAHDRHQGNGEIFDRCTYLPIRSIDDVPIQVETCVTIRVIDYSNPNPNNQRDLTLRDQRNLRILIHANIISRDLFDHETEESKEYYNFGFSSKCFKNLVGGIPVNEITTINQIKQEAKFVATNYILNIMAILPTLWFDKFNGNFKSGKLNKSFQNLFKFDNTKTTKECNECVVCYELTTTKTVCGHDLCYKCNESIEVVHRHHEDPGMRPCPMCRENLLGYE